MRAPRSRCWLTGASEWAHVATVPCRAHDRATVLTRRLGDSALEVSALSLGSWRTFERIERAQALAVMEAAREEGIGFLDDARYDDETASAPIPTGYSEVVFGELFAASGYDRAEVVVTNKLWWEFWPDQSAEAEVRGSLERMGFDYLDLIYSSTVPAGLPLEVVVESVAGLIEGGTARHWGIVNWPGESLERAGDLCDANGVPQPIVAQLPYNLVQRDWAEGTEMTRALERTGASIVASSVLAGGALTGKYQRGESGRLGQGEASAGGALAEPVRQLDALARAWATSPAALAIVFALSRPRVGSVLFGATTAAQVRENAAALDVLGRLTDAQLKQLGSVGG
jgi:aryl-alcohol dehydrogenase-like predicted oxidoreductase